MSAGAEYEVSLDTLFNHAAHVQSVADDVALAADAASHVDLDGGAFGVLCSFLPVFVNDAETATAGAVLAAAQTLDAMAEGVRGMARDFGAADDAVSLRLSGMVTP
ncbi:hypothetical protein [Sanguibacter sp. 25GB23B1]|uniref:hypothetical protein n=1 Tax=unclassified Sanguibacter TaxID=2645534 RepID=UPI0032AFCECA